jgi:hypothetical protein
MLRSDQPTPPSPSLVGALFIRSARSAPRRSQHGSWCRRRHADPRRPAKLYAATGLETRGVQPRGQTPSRVRAITPPHLTATQGRRSSLTPIADLMTCSFATQVVVWTVAHIADVDTNNFLLVYRDAITPLLSSTQTMQLCTPVPAPPVRAFVWICLK